LLDFKFQKESKNLQDVSNKVYIYF